MLYTVPNDRAPFDKLRAGSSTSSGQAPSTSSGQAPSTSSGQAPSTSSGQAPSTSSGQAPSTSSGQAKDELSDALERGEIVYFPECPIALPPPEDLCFLREGL